MSAVTKFFFTPVRESRSTWAVINWWESRRVAYNVTLGALGLVTLGAHALFTLLPPRASGPGLPLSAVLLYAVLANACYTLGPMADVFIRRKWGDAYEAVGPTLFRYGFVFSVGLTLLPIPLFAIGWLFRLLSPGG